MSEESEVNARSVQVNNLLTKKDKPGALVASLQNPPVSSKSEEVKEANAAIVEKVLSQISESDIPNVIAALSPEDCDVLMKYLYRIMAKSSNSALILKLHAQLLEKAGVGSIVRVLTDRKQV